LPSVQQSSPLSQLSQHSQFSTLTHDIPPPAQTQPQETIMAKFDTPEDAVTAGSQILDSAEQKSIKLREVIGQLDAVIEAGGGFNTGGQFPGLGRTLVGELRGEVASIAGAVGKVQQRLYALHARLTKVAQDGGHDVPQPFGGGDR
jgi:hypothetical protein